MHASHDSTAARMFQTSVHVVACQHQYASVALMQAICIKIIDVLCCEQVYKVVQTLLEQIAQCSLAEQ